MARYRLVLGGVVQSRTVEAAAAPSLALNKGFWARETDEPPAFDPATQTRTGPTWAVTPPAGGNEGTVVAAYVVSARPHSETHAAIGAGNAAGFVRRRARRLQDAGDVAGALLLLKQIGE